MGPLRGHLREDDKCFNTMMNTLTKKQREILDYILKIIRERNYTPSHREIATALGLSSPATVHEHVQRLREKGYLEANEDGARISVTEGLVESARAVLLPLMGLITAGEPIEAVAQNETIAVPTSFVRDSGESFVLKVQGRSMIEDGIFDGDYVVIERSPVPKNGDVVVALIEDTHATLKRFYKEKDRIRLQPANHEMQPMYFHGADVQVQGVVRAVIRKF